MVFDDMNTFNLKVNYLKKISYEIISTSNLFDLGNDVLLKGGATKNSSRFIVLDEAVYLDYFEKLRTYFENKKIKCQIVPFAAGEKHKSFECYQHLLRQLDRFLMNRRQDCIIAIGGGVLTDITGFVASSYRRGIPHIKIPTTLMGYVDASVGIKTGINFNGFKNRIGSFEAPKTVILYRTFLKTLTTRHILNGLGEILKLAIIRDYELFKQLELHGFSCIESKFQSSIADQILSRSINGMIEELEPNLFETNLERAVDFGHTFSPMLEMQNRNELLHGEAVSIDMAFSIVLSYKKGILKKESMNRIFNLMINLGLPLTHHIVSPALLWKSLIERTYHRDGLQRVPLSSDIGKAIFINDITYEDICSAFELYQFKINQIKYQFNIKTA